MTIPQFEELPKRHEVTVALGEQYGEFKYELVYVTTAKELEEVHEWLAGQKFVLIDTETSGLSCYDDHLATLQLGNPLSKDKRVFVIDLRCFLTEAILPLLRELADPKRAKVGQNVKFEYKFIRSHYGVKLRNLKDTQVAELLIRSGLFNVSSFSKNGEENRAAYGMTSMDSLCKRYLGISIDKAQDLRTSFYTTAPGLHNLRQRVYAAGDVIYPAFIALEQKKEVVARGLEGVLNIENRFVHVLAESEYTGIMLNTARWKELWQEAVVEQAKHEKVLHAMLRDKQQTELFKDREDFLVYPKTGRKFNFDSPEQVKYFIKTYCELTGWKVKVITKESDILKIKKEYGQKLLDKIQAEDASADAGRIPDWVVPHDKYCLLYDTQVPTLRLAKITGQLPVELVDALVNYAKYSNPISTFGNEFIKKNVRSDGRVHTEFHQLITDTGRMSSSPNLQNIPKDARYRECFIPTPGRKFIIADYSQIEPRITAQVSQDPTYLRTFQNDLDIYIAVAEEMLQIKLDPDNKEEDKILRQIFKVVVLAMAYRMGWYKLWRTLVLALEEPILAGKTQIPTYDYVKALHKEFLVKMAKLKEYQDLCSNLANPKDSPRPKIWDRMLSQPVTWVEAPCGRKRFFGPGAKNTYTEGSNAPIQGHSATIMKAAAVLFDDYCYANNINASIVNLVHDEIIVEADADIAEDLAPVVKELLEKAGRFWLTDVPVKAEFPKKTTGVVDCWRK